MKRFVAVLLVITLSFSLFADALPQYEPYKKEEFPIWSQHLRRGETLFFGSFAITLSAVTLSYSLANTLGANLPTTPAVDVLLVQAGVAGVLSLGIAVADYFIGKAQEKNNAPAP
jgi:hypothetical protein